MTLNKWLKIIVPILIVCIVGGIWFVKNKDELNAAKVMETTEVVESNEVADTNENTDTNKEAEAVKSTENEKSIEESIEVLAATHLDLDELKSYGLPIMIDFGADECASCKEMAPILEDLNETYSGKVIVKFVDVWKYPDLTDKFPLEVIPTQFFFDEAGNPYNPADPDGMGMQRYQNRVSEEHVYTAHRGGMTKDQILAVFEEMGVKP